MKNRCENTCGLGATIRHAYRGTFLMVHNHYQIVL